MASDRLRADALFAAGCYKCLEEALTLYDRVATTSRHHATTARERAFDAAVLLAVRDRELGLRAHDHEPAVQSRLSSLTGRRAAVFADVIEQVPWQAYAATGAERDARLVHRHGRGESVSELRTQLSSLPVSDPTAQYLLQTLDCLAAEDGSAESAPPAAAAAVSPLMLYRAATCSVPDVDALERLAQIDVRFAEGELLIGNAALNGGALLSAERHHAAALHAFPGMLPAAMQLGRVHVMLEEYEASLPEYHQVLDVIPDQVDAMLGKARTERAWAAGGSHHHPRSNHCDGHVARRRRVLLARVESIPAEGT